MRYKKILFVCSGNQCRSPMAEAILQDTVNKDPEFGTAGIEVKSAGTFFGIDGAPATANAMQTMEERGLNLGSHRAKRIDSELVDWADIIWVMGQEHRHYIVNRFKGANEKVHLITEFIGDDGDVFDPVGCGIKTYRACANLLESLIDGVAKIISKQ